MAAKQGRWDVVKALVEAGADVTWESWEPWDYGDELSGDELSGDEWTALSFAAKYEQLDVVKVLIEALQKAGVNLESEGSPAEHALGVAAEWGCLEVVKLLLNAGVDVNSWEYNGYTALSHATSAGEWDIVEVLLEAGADDT